MPDLLIKNARVIDGSGAEAFHADLAVEKGIITQIDTQIDYSCPNTVDGSGLVVCPGFIDMHTHSDFTLLLEPLAESRVRQGVTTEVTGNCGGSPGPILHSGQDAFMEYMTDLGKYYKSHIPRNQWNWETLDEFYDQLSARGSAVNVVPLVGHSTLRANVMGYENRVPDKQEMKQMQHLLRAELEKGAFGLSSGLIYHPGAFADKQELIKLAVVVNDFHGIYSTHMRSEGKFLFEAVDEALSVARESGVSLQISHLKCETPVMWGKSGLLLGKIDQARKEGIRVDFDQYPYTAYHTSLLEIFPFWAKEGGSTKMLDILNSAKTRQKVVAEMMHPPDDWDNPMDGLGWDQIQIVGYRRPENKELNGLTVSAMAEVRGLEPLEAIFQVFCEEKGGLGMIVFAMSEKDLTTILQHPDGMVGSVDNVEITGPHSVVIHMKYPDPNMFFNMSQTFMAIPSMEAYKKYGEEFGTKYVVGSGPYKFESWSPGNELVLVKNEAYTWGPGHIKNKGPAVIDKVIYRDMKEESTRFLELKTGKLDVVFSVPTMFIKKIEEDKTLRIIRQPGDQLYHMVMNTQSAPLDNKLVRKGIALAINQERITESVFANAGKPGYTFLIDSLPSSEVDKKDQIRFDPEGSNSALEEAGWKMGPDGIRVDKDGKKLELKLLAKNESSYRRSAEVIQAQLLKAGVDVKITLMDPSSIRAYYKKGEHQLAIRSYEWENADILEWFLNSKRMGYPNAAMWHDNESDYLMQKAMTRSRSPEERVANFKEYHTHLLQQYVWAPFYLPDTIFAVGNRLVYPKDSLDRRFMGMGVLDWDLK